MRNYFLFTCLLFTIVTQVNSNTAEPYQPPVVSAGPDQTITLPQKTLLLTATASDPDGTIVKTTWKQISGQPLTLNPGPEGSFTLTLSNLIAGKYRFSIRVNDNHGLSAISTVFVTVLPEAESFLDGNFQIKSASVVGSCLTVASNGVINLTKCVTSNTKQVFQYDPLIGRIKTFDGKCLDPSGTVRVCTSSNAFWVYDNNGQWHVNYGTQWELLKCMEPTAFSSTSSVRWALCTPKKKEQLWGISEINEPIKNSDIIQSMTQLIISGEYQAINAMNPPAIPVAVDSLGIPLITVSQLGQGRVAGVGMLRFLENIETTAPTYQQLMQQLIRWLGKKQQPTVAIGLGYSHTYSKALTTLGFTPIGKRDLDHLNGVDVYVIHAQYCDVFTKEDLAKLRNFVKSGGALLTGRFHVSWGNPDYFPANECLAWGLMAEAGIAMSVNNGDKSIVGESVPLKPVVDSKVYNMANAVEALARHQSGLEILSQADLDAIRRSSYWGMITKTIIDGRSSFSLATKALREALGPLQISLENCYFINRDWIQDVGLFADYALTQSLKPHQQIVHSTVGTYPAAVGEGVMPETLSLTTTLNMGSSTPAVNQGVSWVSTGFYALPGELVNVTAPASLGNKEVRIRIGHQVDDELPQTPFYRPQQFCRFPMMNTAALLRSEANSGARAQLSNAFGGLVYILAPFGLNVGEVTLSFSGVTRAPTFVDGESTNSTWAQQVAEYPVPFGEWTSDRMIISADTSDLNASQDAQVSVKALRDMQDAQRYMAGIRSDSTLYGFERVPRRVSFTSNQLWGAHNGYPIYITSAWAKELATLSTIPFASGLWAYLHESGHNWDRSEWMFSGNWSEITPNVFATYAFKKVMTDQFRISYANAWGDNLSPARRVAYRNQYLNDPSKSYTNISFAAGLDMFVTLMEKFGWDTLADLDKIYRDLPPGTVPTDTTAANDKAKADYFVTAYSKLVGVNIAPYFQRYRIPLSPSVVSSLAASGMPAWNGTT